MNRISLLCLISGLLCLASCAQELNPTGGQKDTIPPKVVKTNPDNEVLEFEGTVLKIIFDEAIQKPDIKKDIFISPFVNRPSVTISDNGKRLTIDLEEDLRPQTTYVITLNGIRDHRERNQIEEPYTLAFSTGTQLDSLELQGIVEDVEGAGVANMLVLLFDADSVLGNDILNKRPAYLTRTDESGSFSFKFLRNAPYRVFGLMDGDQSNTFSSVTEAVAMSADSVLTLSGDTTNLEVVRLISFLIDENPPRLRRYFWTNDSTLAVQVSESVNLSATTVYATDTSRIDTSVISALSFIPGADKELWVHVPGGKQWMDLHFYGLQDSLGNAVDSILRVEPEREREWDEPLSNSPTLRLQDPSIEFLPGKLVTEADRQFFSLTDTSSFDTARQVFELEWMPEGFYQRIRPEGEDAIGIPLVLKVDGAFFYSPDDSTAIDTVYSFPVTWLQADAYGSITGTVIPDSSYEGPFFINMKGAKGIVRSFSDTAFSFQNIEAGDYSFEVIYDEDDNGILTTGSLIQYRLPERRKNIPGSITIRANWDFEDHVVDLNTREPDDPEVEESEEEEVAKE